MVSSRLRTRPRLPQMEWTDSWSTVANAADPHRSPSGLVPRTVTRDNLVSPTSIPASPCAYTAKFDAGAVSSWIETAALDSTFSLDDDRTLDREFGFFQLLGTRSMLN